MCVDGAGSVMSSVITVRVGATQDDSYEELRLELEEATGLEWTLTSPGRTGKLNVESYILATIVSGIVGGVLEEATKQVIEIARTRLKEWLDRHIDPPESVIAVEETPRSATEGPDDESADAAQ
jgi:hypothetical protein